MQIGIIYIATLPNGFFGSSSVSWESLSTDKIANKLHLFGCAVKVITIDQVVSTELCERDILIYTSSEDPRIRQYVIDHVYLAARFCHVIPSLDALLAHENKGFQQIYREKMNFGDLPGKYFFHLNDALNTYPYVFKTATGAGSSGVKLIRSSKHARRLRSLFKVSPKRIALFLMRWLMLDKRSYEVYKYRYKGKCLAVAQEFVPNLRCDYKVLIFGEKYFVLERAVRKKSFKASGSGLFRFPSKSDLPSNLLCYAEQMFYAIGSPYASLDIAVSGSKIVLIEYQATNFGPYTLVNSGGYFSKNEEGWFYVEGRSSLEECFSDALHKYIKTHYYDPSKKI